MSKPEDSLLQKYRKFKPVPPLQHLTLVPHIGGNNNECSLFEAILKQKQGYQCRCPKNQQKYCKFIVSWIDNSNYNRKDPFFIKTYLSYSKKHKKQTGVKQSLQKISQILDIKLHPEQKQQILQILFSFIDHTKYYKMKVKLVDHSNIYIWICLGIAYHVGFARLTHDNDAKSIVFWALDIAMSHYADLTPQAMNKHYLVALEKLSILQLGADLRIVIKQWVNQMMFGYMGIHFIAFSVDCFIKIKWDHLYKLILSYFQLKQEDLKVNNKFMNKTISEYELYSLIVNGKKGQQWPVVFSNTFRFKYEENSTQGQTK